jgi:hypothetical protein
MGVDHEGDLRSLIAAIQETSPGECPRRNDLLARVPELGDGRAWHAFLRRYTAQPLYLAAFVDGATRHDLDGLPAGTVTPANVARAQRTLANRAPAAGASTSGAHAT